MNYHHLLKIGMVISLLCCVIFFQVFKRMREDDQVTRRIGLVLDVVNIPQTQ